MKHRKALEFRPQQFEHVENWILGHRVCEPILLVDTNINECFELCFLLRIEAETDQSVQSDRIRIRRIRQDCAK